MFQKRKMRRLFYTIAAIYFALILLVSVYYPSSALNPWYFEGMSRGQEFKIFDMPAKFSYLYVANTTALTLLFIVSRVKQFYVKLLIIPFGSYLLLLCGSRASLAGFIAASIIACTIQYRKKRGNKGKARLVAVTLVGILGVLTITYGPIVVDQVFKVYGNTYRFDPSEFTGKKAGQSYLIRGIILRRGVYELREIWLLGRYMSDVAEGRAGSYIHNWLSFWTYFGIGPFLLSVILIMSALYKSTKQFLKDSNSTMNELLFLWCLYMIMLIVAARSVSYYYIWFIIFGGAMINRRSTSKFVYTLSPQENMRRNYIGRGGEK